MKSLFVLALALAPLSAAEGATVVRVATQTPPIVIEAIGPNDGIVVVSDGLLWERIAGDAFLVFTRGDGKKARVRVADWRSWTEKLARKDDEVATAIQQSKAIMAAFLPMVRQTGEHLQVAGLQADVYSVQLPDHTSLMLAYSHDPRLSAATTLFYDAFADLTASALPLEEAKQRGIPVRSGNQTLVSLAEKPNTAVPFDRNARLLRSAKELDDFFDG